MQVFTVLPHHRPSGGLRLPLAHRGRRLYGSFDKVLLMGDAGFHRRHLPARGRISEFIYVVFQGCLCRHHLRVYRRRLCRSG